VSAENLCIPSRTFELSGRLFREPCPISKFTAIVRKGKPNSCVAREGDAFLGLRKVLDAGRKPLHQVEALAEGAFWSCKIPKRSGGSWTPRRKASSP
jgi:hypothetical protein